MSEPKAFYVAWEQEHHEIDDSYRVYRVEVWPNSYGANVESRIGFRIGDEPPRFVSFAPGLNTWGLYQKDVVRNPDGTDQQFKAAVEEAVKAIVPVIQRYQLRLNKDDEKREANARALAGLGDK